jgi:signal transduction histidine kinase
MRMRDRLCWLAAVLVLLLGVVLWAVGRPSVGLAVESDAGGRPVVTAVEAGSLAWAVGAQPGMVVTQVDLSPPSSTFSGSEGHQIRLIDERDRNVLEVTSYTAAYGLLLPALWVGVSLLACCWVIGRRQPFLAALAAPFGLAATTPLALVPAMAFGSPTTLAIGAVVWPLSVVPLAVAMAGQGRSWRNVTRARGTVMAALLGALGLAPLLYVVPAPAGWVAAAREVLVAVALLGPVALVAPISLREGGAWVSSWQPLVRALGLAAVAATPLVIHLALTAPSVGLAVGALVLWLVAGLAVTRFVVVPLTGLAARALRQRDLVAAAADAERRRIAADLHDGPLQSLTLLAYRLDSAGDVENAGFARDVVTELRAVTSSLRLPVVDDLGAGPALEWLTIQVGRLSGQEIELERADDGRPPIDVEHAVFRIAQEALANATRHGRPPIRVRYEAAPSRASLIVDDAGAGLAAGEPTLDHEPGLGVVGMRERAHAIGAVLEIGPSPGGSRVSLVWPGAVP